MKVILSRDYEKNETLGTLIVFSGQAIAYRCKCLELPNNGNQKMTSCIPEGIYQIIKETNEKHGQHFRILDVPGRNGILIHSGNYAAGNHVDTEGCILPGAYFVDINGDGNIDIADSKKTMTELYAILPDKFELHII